MRWLSNNIGNEPGGASRRFEGRILFAAAMASGLVAVLVLSFAAAAARSGGAFGLLVSSALSIAAAAGLAGALLGFLFGIPRTLQSENDSTAGSSKTSMVGNYSGNTNLEQMSDWLTKILVGVSLVQLGKVGPALAQLGDGLRPMLGGTETGRGFGVTLSIFALVSGFLLSYLWTRVRLKREMELADEETSAQETAGETKAALEALRSEYKSDLAMVAKGAGEAIRTLTTQVDQLANTRKPGGGPG